MVEKERKGQPMPSVQCTATKFRQGNPGSLPWNALPSGCLHLHEVGEDADFGGGAGEHDDQPEVELGDGPVVLPPALDDADDFGRHLLWRVVERMGTGGFVDGGRFLMRDRGMRACLEDLESPYMPFKNKSNIQGEVATAIEGCRVIYPAVVASPKKGSPVLARGLATQCTLVPTPILHCHSG